MASSLPRSLGVAACVFVYLEPNKRAKGSTTAEMLASVSFGVSLLNRSRGVNIYKESFSVKILRFSFEFPHRASVHILEDGKAFVIISQLRNFFSNRTFVRMNASHSSR